MNHLFKTATIVMCLTLIGSAQTISNVQFTDMKGKSYDLYQILGEGKSVLCHFSFNT